MKDCLAALAAIFSAGLFCSGPVRGGENWIVDPEARVVLGQTDFDTAVAGDGQAGLSRPAGVALDPATGKAFVMDTGNHRVLRYASFAALSNGVAAEAVLGQSDFATVTAGTAPGKMSAPYAGTMDSGGRLWVVDRGNNRVLKFNDAATRPSGGNADGVLGQPGFVTGGISTSRDGMKSPSGIAIDSTGVLFVADTFSNRVLIFADAADLADADGADATGLLGQPNFTDDTNRTSQQGLAFPRGLAVDAADNLYIADASNNRVLRYDLARDKGPGGMADGVLGQADFDTVGGGPGANRFTFPYSVAVDPEGRLWVADLFKHRVIGFSNAATLPPLASADLLLGQRDFATADPALSIRGLTSAAASGGFDFSFGVGTDAAGRVYVADSGNQRVVIFTRDSHRPDARIGLRTPATRGNGIYNASGAGQIQPRVHRKRGKATWSARFENDGNVPDSYRIRSSPPTSRFRISVFRLTGGRINVTAATRAGLHVTSEIAARGILDYQHEIVPFGKKRDRKAALAAWMQGTSTTDGSVDRVVSKMVYRPK